MFAKDAFRVLGLQRVHLDALQSLPLRRRTCPYVRRPCPYARRPYLAAGLATTFAGLVPTIPGFALTFVGRATWPIRSPSQIPGSSRIVLGWFPDIPDTGIGPGPPNPAPLGQPAREARQAKAS